MAGGSTGFYEESRPSFVGATGLEEHSVTPSKLLVRDEEGAAVL